VVRRARPERGYTLLEIVMVLAIFGIFILVLVEVTADMMHYERRHPVNFMMHPQVSVVVARMQRDVEDTTFPYYLQTWDTYNYGPKILILYVLTPGGAQDVVWDFSQPGEVHRYSYNVGVKTEWVARGLPDFQITDFPIVGKPDSVRIKAYDQGGKLAIDQIFQPRPHPTT
jgi:prepilin-type N-terminal cleavage/methylation domain-containing protein